jgi:TM2 domain-containing membrane protein YozV
MSEKVKKKNPIVSAMLSLVVAGLGQIYNGQIGLGILYFCLVWTIPQVVLVAMPKLVAYIAVIEALQIITQVYVIYDAYTGAGKINQAIT